MKVTTRATMTVYRFSSKHKFSSHSIDCRLDPKHASIRNDRHNGTYIFELLIQKLQKKGVKPGTDLKITVETIRPKRKTRRPS